MFKKVIAMLGMALLSLSAFAADAMKGVNQNGFTESVGYDFIASAKIAGGVISYRTIYSADVYTLTDANGSQFNAWLVKLGSDAKTSQVNGWTYDLSKAKISCQYSSSVINTPGRISTETVSDNCALAN